MDKKNSSNNLRRSLGVATAVLIGFSGAASGATLTYSTGTPTLLPGDISSFTGATRDGLNVNNDGANWQDGSANDQYTYVAGDRPAQGQFFTTGPDGLLVDTIWVRHVGYTDNGSDPAGGFNGTWYNFDPGGDLTIRITDPAQVGEAGFVLHSEALALPADDPNQPASGNSDNGTGIWLGITLASPFALAPNTEYGFDLDASNRHFQLLGTVENAYAGGSAYNANGDILFGDRVFAVSAIPEPSTWALGLGVVALLAAGIRRRMRR